MQDPVFFGFDNQGCCVIMISKNALLRAILETAAGIVLRSRERIRMLYGE